MYQKRYSSSLQAFFQKTKFMHNMFLQTCFKLETVGRELHHKTVFVYDMPRNYDKCIPIQKALPSMKTFPSLQFLVLDTKHILP